ncbi:MAG TPA: hypothetical protein VL243_05895 [Vicinamibacterales bacterium]|nr:hypothetical protein [Vicinamibacterales bacterium]
MLRALHEAGIKLDVMSGRGIGVVGALFAAIDAAPKTWEEGGLWRRTPAVRLYRWRRALQAAALLLAIAAAVLVIPLLVLATGLVAYPLGFLVQMISVDAGHRLVSLYTGWIASAFEPGALPTYIPRLVTLAIAGAVGALVVSALRPAVGRRKQPGHRARGPWWTRLAGSAWCVEPGLDHFLAALWPLFRGPANDTLPGLSDLSRRYLDLLSENLGQPGFRELMLTTVDLETRTDLIFAALREDRRTAFFHRRQAELIDLAGVGRNQVMHALAGALSLPVLTRPHVITFSPESYWKGEAHRSCDRPAAVERLMHELANAGVEQVVVASASADRSTPHRLDAPGGTLAARVAEHLAAAEATAIRDAVASQAARFHGVFVIQPAHNPVGPFDYEGAFDERSDRFQSIGELIDRGYEDAYRQFIEPVVGGD